MNLFTSSAFAFVLTFSDKVYPPFLYSVCGGRLPFLVQDCVSNKSSFVLIDV